MPPLTRQDTRPSIHSYWSDSDPGLQGPTINLHAAAKPLMRLMYHRQVLAFIRKNRDSPLSTPTLEIYLSYFPWNYVSSATKHAILEELISRSTSEADARAIVDSPVFNDIVQMLGSTDIGMRISSCRLLAGLAGHECNSSAILELETFERLAALLRGEHFLPVIECALNALSQIARWSYPQFRAKFLLQDGKMLEHVLGFLTLPLPGVREKACNLLGWLFGHRLLRFQLGLNQDTCEKLVSLLADERYPTVAEAATYALSQFARCSDVEQDMIDDIALQHVWVLLESPIPKVQQWTCQLVGRFAVDEFTAAFLLEICRWLVSFLRDPAIRADAIFAVFAISQRPDGVAALGNTNTFEELQGLSQSADVETKVRIHMILDNLAWYKAGKI